MTSQKKDGNISERATATASESQGNPRCVYFFSHLIFSWNIVADEVLYINPIQWEHKRRSYTRFHFVYYYYYYYFQIYFFYFIISK